MYNGLVKPRYMKNQSNQSTKKQVLWTVPFSPPAYLCMLVLFVFGNLGLATAQQSVVQGTVTDPDGVPLPGASIVEKGTTNGTQTDFDGNFSLSVSDENATLAVSYIGFAAQDIALNGQTNVTVTLQESAASLDEVVVVGYGKVKKRDLTGAVAKADIEAFEESPNVSVLQSLQGSVPGLNVGAVTQAGTDPNISIRGRTSISGSNSPLIVLDGIIYRGSMVDLNPNDIASIDVLKDASAAAVYGSQASNGVILITTKEGTSEKVTVEYNTSYSVQQIASNDLLPVDAAGFVQKIRNRYLTESRTGPDLLTMNPDFDPATKLRGPEVQNGFRNGTDTDWWGLLTNKAPSIQKHNLSVRGSGKTGSYFFSLGLTDQQNVVKNDNYKRYNYRINLDSKIADWLTVGVQSFLTIGDKSGASPSLSKVMGLPPLAPAFDENGDIVPIPYSGRASVSPLLDVQQQDLEKRNNLFGLLYLDVDIPFIKGLNYRLNFSQNLITDKNYNFDANAQNFLGAGYKTNASQYSSTVDNILTYVKDFGEHSINGTLLYGYEKRQYENTTARSIIFSNDVLGYNKLEAGQADLQTVDSNAWEEASLYAMLRLVYNYKNRYTLTGTVRRDGFSGFGPENKFAVFPSLAAWRISEENFIRDNFTALDELKLRASYGVNGNRTLERYQTLAQINSSFSNGYLYGDGAPAEIGQFISSLPNPNLKWESTKSLNLGLDFSFYNNRLAGNLEYYTANTFDLLYNINIPYLNGFGSTPVNIGKLKNSGVELNLNTVPIRTEDFNWNLNFNFSRNRNEVSSILGIDNDGDGNEDDLVSSNIFIGEPYGVAYDYNIIGMWQVDDFNAGNIPDGFTYGTYKVEDINGDGEYTADEDRKILGYTDPSYRFSIQNSLSYKDWELSFFINAIQGGKDYYYDQPGSSLANPDNIGASNLFDFDYWTPENPDARYRQIGFYTVALGETFSPYVQRSFVRLQDATISYKLPKSVLEKLNITRAKLFVNGKNLLIFTDYDGWDPESVDDNGNPYGFRTDGYPLLRSYTVGLSLEF